MKIKPANFLKISLFAFLIGSYLYLLSFYLMSSDASQSRPLFVEKTELIKSTEKVSRVIDGDTFEIEGGIKIRLIGMDTPEMKNKNRTIDCYAIEAKKRLESLIADKEVVLAKDVSETDKYGRLLRYVYLEDQFVNNTMIKEGYARISTFPPDVKFKDQLLTSERQARETGAGLWSACK